MLVRHVSEEPLSFGLLTGKCRRGPPIPESSRLATMDGPGNIDMESLYKIADSLESIAATRGVSMAQVTLVNELFEGHARSYVRHRRSPQLGPALR